MLSLLLSVVMAETEPDEQYLSPQRAAKMLDVSGDTLRKWARDGRVRCVWTPGKRRRYLLSDLQAILKAEG